MIKQKFNIEIPNDIITLANQFSKYGYNLYLVGGCVRDFLIGKEPKDFDLCTEAEPNAVIEIIQSLDNYKALPIGIDFGVITALTSKYNEYEIATMRKDIGSGRRPDSVEFTSIEEDVMRRDLTINALYYDITNKEIIDFVGGINDIENNIIKTVGSPYDRFDEDKLRVLRAIRFSARMDSQLDEETKNAIHEHKNLNGISSERIKDEFMKGLKSCKSFEYFLSLIDEFSLYQKIFGNLNINKSQINDSIDNIYVVIALLLNDNNIDDVNKNLNKHKFSRKEIELITALISLNNLNVDTAYELKKSIDKKSIDSNIIKEYATYANIDKKLIDTFIKFILTVSSSDLMDNGFYGADLGKQIKIQETENFKELLNPNKFILFTKQLTTKDNELLIEAIIKSYKLIYYIN